MLDSEVRTVPKALVRTSWSRVRRLYMVMGEQWVLRVVQRECLRMSRIKIDCKPKRPDVRLRILSADPGTAAFRCVSWPPRWYFLEGLTTIE